MISRLQYYLAQACASYANYSKKPKNKPRKYFLCYLTSCLRWCFFLCISTKDNNRYDEKCSCKRRLLQGNLQHRKTRTIMQVIKAISDTKHFLPNLATASQKRRSFCTLRNLQYRSILSILRISMDASFRYSQRKVTYTSRKALRVCNDCFLWLKAF